MTQANKIVILEKQTRQSILMEQLKANPSIVNTTYVSLNVFLNTLVRDERNLDWFKAARLLEENAQVGGILENTLRYPISTDHLMTFIQTMADEDWTLEDLPNTNPKEQALKDILQVLAPDFQRRAQQWAALNAYPDLASILVYDHFYPFAISVRLKYLEKQGLRIMKFPQTDPQVTVKFAKNPRSEAQACVQDILTNAIPYDQQVIVCLDEALQDQVETFLIRHELPYFRVNEHRATSALKLFEDLLSLRSHPDHDHLLELIENDSLNLPSRINLIDYVKTFKIDAQTALSPFTQVEKAFEDGLLKHIVDEGAYLRLEKNAEKEIKPLRPQLEQLIRLDQSSYEPFITSFFELYVSFLKDLSESDIQSINLIKNLLEQGHPELKQMKDPYSILIYLIDNQTLNTKQSSGIILTELKHAYVFGKQRAYFLGCTQDGYPQYGAHSGLIDEDYLKHIRGYDPKARYDDHIQRLNTLRHGFKEVVYSYPLGSYEGKAQKLPYELEHYFETKGIKASAWRIAEKYPEPVQAKPKLDPELAQRLYFPNMELRGSVSSFERHFKCPYQYFLFTGIGLGTPNTYGLTNREIGNLMHYVLETGVKEYGKHYADSLRGQESQRLAPLIDHLKQLFPHQKQSIELMRERAVILLKLSLEFLDSRERNTEFAPSAIEQAFDTVIELDKDVPMHLVGKIDRIDTTEYGFMIIDYKSSSKRLQEKQVMEGVQIQLCTYLWMGQKILDLKTPYGAFYFSFGQSNIKLVANDLNDPQQIWKNGRKLNGWFTGDPHPVDFDGTHHNNLSIKENGEYKYPGGFFKADAIETQMRQLYASLIDDLSQGTITKRNKADSCAWCAYKQFCQYKGTPVKIASIKKAESVLR